MKIFKQPFLAFISVALVISACEEPEDSDDKNNAGVSDAPTGTLAIGTLEDIPQITDPVAEYAASDVSTEAAEAKAFDSLQISSSLTNATRGLKFGDTPSFLQSAFDGATNPSEAYCFSLNTAMLALANVSESDLNLCMLKGSLSDQYDQSTTEYQYAEVSFEDEGESIVSKYKFRIETDSAGRLTSFENFVCESIDGEDIGQIGYQKVTRVDNKLTIWARSFGEEDGLKLRVRMEANLDENDSLVGLKTIDYAETTEGEGLARKVAGLITQSSNNFEFAFFTSSAGGTNRLITFTELLDANLDGQPYAITNVGFGDGASLINRGSGSRTEGWNGDTTELNASEPRLVKVEGREAELPIVTDPDNLELASDEVWDCQSTNPTAVELSETTLEQCSERYEVTQDLFNMCSRFYSGGGSSPLAP